MPSTEAMDPATNSASIEDRMTRLCFLDTQDIGALLNIKTQPLVDLRLFMSPAKSESV